MTSPASSASVANSVGGAGSGGAKICFNTYCKEPKSEGSLTRRKGWRLRSGEHADLCDRCSTSYEQGTFCETFHLDDDGWKKCATCGKRVHCGCIVSATSFALLDVGGVECISCAQKNFLLGSNQMWSSSNFLSSERLKELPGKSWSQLSTSTAVPGQWRQAPNNAWRASVSAQSELHQRLSFEFDRPNSIERLISSNRSLVSEKRKVDDLHERPMSTGLNRITIDKHSNGSTGPKPSGFSTFHRDDVNADRLQESNLLVGDSDHNIPTRKGVIQGSRLSSSAGIKIEKVPNACISTPHRSPLLKDGSKSPIVCLASPLLPSLEPNDQIKASTNHVHNKTPSSSMAKQLYHNLNSAIDSTSELQAQLHNGRTRVDSRTRNHLLPRYWPRITDQELQQISGDSNSVITPLFEKMLSASDAGRIGRLVLPKKCAEAYFPAISQPEGLPLKVQDSTGKEWIFQFRFWPNNNSRMYVLEGVTPCIQSMQLQAGDIVTFSRIDPDGKLVMGFRKASNTKYEQAPKSGNGFSSTSETSNGNNKQDRTTLSKNDKAEFIKKERPVSKGPLLPTKRKSSIVASKSKRLRIENEDSIELKLTWEEAQELLRPASIHVPSIVVIEGHEFEEYEEAPILGKPTIFTTNQDGGKDQWAQCEDCLKWRKLPLDASLPPRWTCLDNIWDHDRSSCLSAQEISKGQLADLLPFNNSANSKKSKAKVESVEGSEGLDTLANLAIMSESESLPHCSQPTTKHPRHRPGCTCIVCIQPPSGKGSKHKQSCGCNVCLTVKRRFHTLMLRKEKRLSEKEAETTRKKQLKQQNVSPETSSQQESDKGLVVVGVQNTSDNSTPNDVVGDEEDDSGDRKKQVLPSQMKTEIDLNMQPEKEEEDTSPVPTS